MQKPILDQDFQNLTTEEKLEVSTLLLQRLIDSSQLSLKSEINDMLEFFGDHEFKPKPDADMESFNAALASEGELEAKDAIHFVDQLSDNGDTHLCFEILRAKQFLFANNR